MRAGAFLFFSCLTLILTPPFAEMNADSFYPLAPEIRVGILSKYAPAKITLSGEHGVIFAGDGKYNILGKATFIASNNSVLIYDESHRPLAENARVSAFFPERYTVYIDQNSTSFSRIYSGSLEIRAEGGVLIPVVVMKTGEYARATARSELGGFLYDRPDAGARGWENELVSAVEISVCSYIAAQKNRHSGKNYDFCDLTHCANFQGLSDTRENRRRDLLKVMVSADGKPVSGFFHTACGGILASPESYWGGVSSLNYRRGAETFCASSNNFDWSSFFTTDQIESLTGASGLEDVTVEYRDGRVSALFFSAKNGNTRMDASLFLSRAGSTFGWNKIRSNLFGVKKTRDGWNFNGRGFGHGIGLCMWGAKCMAMEGKSAKDILNFFYVDPRVVFAE